MTPDKEAGFSLVELLAVMLVLGVLAAIALPVFFNQKGKANDSHAKATAHLAQVAMETCATDNDGSYAGCDNIPALSAIAPTLAGAQITFPKPATSRTYRVRVASNSGPGHYFEVDRDSEGQLSHPCAAPGVGGCGNSGDWGAG